MALSSMRSAKEHILSGGVKFRQHYVKTQRIKEIIDSFLHLMEQIVSESVRSGDTGNMEARAAVYYWKTIFPDNPYFVREQDADGPNALLNYGYAILRAVVARALVGSGLLPTLGIHHHNRYNAYCLADDIMEPYRPYVDKLVTELLDEDATG